MAKIILSGEVGYEITLYSVVAKVQELRNKGELTSLEIDLTSEGGSSVEGRKIFDFIKSLEVPVTINAVDYVYSAGFTIFLAGQIRTAKDNNTQFLMHSPYFMDIFVILSDEDAKQLSKDIELEKARLAELYSEILTIDKDTIISLMDNDEIISSETAKSLGIISAIQSTIEIVEPYQIAAKWYANNNHKSIIKNLNEMDKKDFEALKTEMQENKSLLAKLTDSVGKLFKANIKALSINSEEGQLLEIEGDELVEGATVTNVTEGVFTVIYAEKTWTVTIENSTVASIVEIVEQTDEEMEALRTENAQLKEQLEGLTAQKTEAETKLAESQELTAKLTEVTKKNEQTLKLLAKIHPIEEKDGVLEFKVDGIKKTDETNDLMAYAKSKRN